MPDAEEIDAKIDALGDWRGDMLRKVRHLIKEADADVVEELKWRKASNPGGVPVWSHDGIICTGETYKDKVKLTFAYGASLEDPKGLFNSKLEKDGPAGRSTFTKAMGSTNRRYKRSSATRCPITSRSKDWWAVTGLIRRPSRCKRGWPTQICHFLANG